MGPYCRGMHGNSLYMSCSDEPISSRQASGDSLFRGGCLRHCYRVKGQRFTTYWHNKASGQPASYATRGGRDIGTGRRV